MFEMSTREKVEKFVRRMLYGRDALHKAPDRIVLSTITVNKKPGTELHTIEIPEKGKTSAEEIQGWISEIEQIAYDDCEDLGGVQRYALLPYFGKQQKNRLTFRMAGEEKDEDSFDSEPPNKAGLVAQSQRHAEASHRHTEVMMRLLISSTNNVVNQYARTVASLATQNEALQGKHVEGMTLLEDLLIQRHEREQENKQADFRMRIQEEAYNDIRPMVPLVVNRLVGKKLLPEQVDAKTQAMKGLMESLRPEQMQRIAGALTSPQQIALFEFYEMFRPEDTKKSPESDSDAETDSNGTNTEVKQG